MPKPPLITPVLAQFGVTIPPQRAQFLGSAGGFSGALFWRVQTDDGPWCLRRWPTEHPTAERLRFIHDVLRHANRKGIRFVPIPRHTIAGDSWLRHAGHFWELTRWLPGRADFRDHPSPARLTAASQALARLHLAIEDGAGAAPTVSTSPTISRRRSQLIQLLGGGADQMRAALHRQPLGKLSAIAAEILDYFSLAAPSVAADLENAAHWCVQQQPVLRDVWHDHVLFEGDTVSGIVDFGAMNIDSVATDVARLVGSLAADDRSRWQTALAAYTELRPLNEQEANLVRICDSSGVLLAGLNWLQWIYVEGREFENQGEIISRLGVILDRLRHLTGNSVVDGNVIRLTDCRPPLADNS